ncbi:trehalose-phosphatase [Halogranum rubrum]|uniref:Trehalose 6-phosphate phosphatase n=1 Tax=Halogranum salarium B-1 TaxID=1210908 RepID=J3JGE0_9EURY|nr:trehalose-phosphatase [Halogranum salarium]EJN60044.1 hypothetical protein HSB1_22020 [Halogranum salarium B-1]
MSDARTLPDDGGLEHTTAVVGARLEAADRVLLCADFDGALTANEGRLPPVCRRQLEQLQATERMTVAVVSDRELVDLRSRVGLDDISYSGSDGVERHADGETQVHPRVHGVLDDTRRVRTALVDAYRTEMGLHVEDRGWSVTVHYGTADADRASELADEVAALVEHVGDERLDVVHENHAIDVRPTVEWDRGVCVETLVDDAPDDYLPVYLGAGETDRPAFQAVERHDGVSVGVDCEGAQTRLDGPKESVAFLRWLTESRGGQHRLDATTHRPHSA